MNTTDLEFFLKENIILDLNSFLLSLIAATVLSLLIQFFYLRYGSTLSNKFEFSKNFVILGITTTIVITIVKSSLALSLGLVGALSIVRFRAAIKEPEELVFLFLIIATGLGCGAGQLKITVVGIIFALLIILVYSVLLKRQKIMIEQMKSNPNMDPRAFLILDDCLYDNTWVKDKNVRSMFMNGRHFKLLFMTKRKAELPVQTF